MPFATTALPFSAALGPGCSSMSIPSAMTQRNLESGLLAYTSRSLAHYGSHQRGQISYANFSISRQAIV